MTWKKKGNVWTVVIPGLTISGDAGSVSQALKLHGLDPANYGIGPFYHSESKNEDILISKMQPEHLKNAIIKRVVELVQETKTMTLKSFHNTIYGNDNEVYLDLELKDKTLVALLEEVENRATKSK
jgi:hypothetical protein